jgi:transposase InsO family protein
MTGYRTKQRYTTATVYVDQSTGLGYVHLQKSPSAEETVESKKAFEAFARSHGVSITQYHADNGIFKASLWLEACKASLQTITFAGVGAHQKNGVAERRIRELQERQGQCWFVLSVDGHQRLRQTYGLMLSEWQRRHQHVTQSRVQGSQNPSGIIQLIKDHDQPKYWQHFGFPVYVLSSNLQQVGGIHHKWKERSKLGIYLGRSPQHARTVALVLDTETGFVSPQFHVKFDPTFQTTREGGHQPPGLWQQKCGFVTEGTSKSEKTSLPK